MNKLSDKLFVILRIHNQSFEKDNIAKLVSLEDVSKTYNDVYSKITKDTQTIWLKWTFDSYFQVIAYMYNIRTLKKALDQE